MRSLILYSTIFFMLVTGVLGTPVICYAEGLSDQIAGEDERAASVEVGEDGMIPVTADQVKEGSYPIEVDSSSSMFRIVEAYLTVQDGQMSAVITLGGKGYLKLFMGTGEEAVASEESAYVPFVEDENGAYTYTVEVEALDKELECTGFSKRKEKWYDHQILFQAATLPKEALLIELPSYEESSGGNRKSASDNGKKSTADNKQKDNQAEVDLEDGVYRIEVELTGGTGRASVTSPANLTVVDKKGTARIEWSSPNYDYMIVHGEKYFPINEEGNSVFEIPVYAYDEAVEVIGDTTAMGEPHEIEYSLIFHADSVRSHELEGKNMSSGAIVPIVVMIVGIIAVAAGIMFIVACHRRGVQ